MALLDEVIALGRCSIELPAGTGKTERIAQLVRQAADRGWCTLILTHTHAGVDSLRRRLRREDIPPAAFHLRTLDSWCFDLISSFPILSGIDVDAEPDWKQSSAYHEAGARALNTTAVERMVRVSYGLCLVDEYQDCQQWQHSLVRGIAQYVPTAVLGDRMQGLLFFRENRPVSWTSDVQAVFRDLPQDARPWRWHDTDPELGQWLLSARDTLLAGKPLALAGSPVQRTSAAGLRSVAARLPGHPQKSVIIRRLPRGCVELSKRLGLGFNMIEELEGRHLLHFAQLVDASNEMLARDALVFAVSCAFGIAEWFGAKERQPLTKSPPRPLAMEKFQEVQAQCLAVNNVIAAPGRDSVLKLFDELARLPGFKLHRREAWFGMGESLRIACASPELSVRDCVVSMRNQLRWRGRYPESRVIARPLLIKGLEFDHVIVDEAEQMNAHELYVSLTRGTRSVTIVSDERVLDPRRPQGGR